MPKLIDRKQIIHHQILIIIINRLKKQLQIENAESILTEGLVRQTRHTYKTFIGYQREQNRR